jgi:hypothetical protein
MTAATRRDQVEAVAREHERRGNAAVASGLMLVARRQFRIADHIRREALRYGDA